MADGERFTLRLANRGGRLIEVGGGEALLAQLERAGEALPYGCRYGACACCVALLLEGEVDQAAGVALSQTDIDAGLVLLCIGRARSDCVLEVGEDCRKRLTKTDKAF